MPTDYTDPGRDRTTARVWSSSGNWGKERDDLLDSLANQRPRLLGCGLLRELVTKQKKYFEVADRFAESALKAFEQTDKQVVSAYLEALKK